MDELKTLRELAEKATPGPWSACGHQRGGCVCGQVWSPTVDFPVATAFREDELIGKAPEGRPQANALYIAAANPAAILSILDRVEKAEAAIQATLQWDADRNYLMPYKVRDPLRAAVAQLDKQEQQ